MRRLKILVCGDSFAASKDPTSWTCLLAQHHDVVQHGWNGCGEYKIYQQLKMQSLADFDLVLISHTSATRVHIKSHPLYHVPHEHAHADLIYEDVNYHRSQDSVLETAARYFEQIFDIEYYEFVHSQILRCINLDLGRIPSLHLFPLFLPNQVPFTHWIDVRSVRTSHPGIVNHYDVLGNQKIYQAVKLWIEKNY